jgi:alkanesulfonate monooxygenase SsuD/methylene tetrahydromethanopterin reductase-like flavin-dependent oxidoreductase (luciferase family)
MVAWWPGVGPGSSARDSAAAGIAFEERWPRFGEAILILRAPLTGDQAFKGAFYSSHRIDLELRPAGVFGEFPLYLVRGWTSDRSLEFHPRRNPLIRPRLPGGRLSARRGGLAGAASVGMTVSQCWGEGRLVVLGVRDSLCGV